MLRCFRLVHSRGESSKQQAEDQSDRLLSRAYFRPQTCPWCSESSDRIAPNRRTRVFDNGLCGDISIPLRPALLSTISTDWQITTSDDAGAADPRAINNRNKCTLRFQAPCAPKEQDLLMASATPPNPGPSSYLQS